MQGKVSAWGRYSTLPYEGPCRVCAPRVPGKDWALLTTGARQSVHMCGGVRRASSKVLSWHASADAAKRARAAYVKEHGQARIYWAKAANKKG